MVRSTSSRDRAPLAQKWHEARTYLRWRWRDRSGPERFDEMFREIEEYRAVYERVSGRRFADARVLEIGFGARPNRIIALMSMNVDVRGVDLDMPMLRFSPRRLLTILMTNGFERALKTGVRSLLFDSRERSLLRAALERRGFRMSIDPARLLVGDAATFDYGGEPVDLIYSESVFEYIPEESLKKLLKRLGALLSPHGVALIAPTIFTGISGGGLPEWAPFLANNDQVERKSEPWEHLRQRRYTANGCMNELPRSAYRKLFADYFEILEENVRYPDLGRRWLTPEVRKDLAQWDEVELFSNNIQFVLRPKTAGRGHRV